jgi:hypothetical protein
MRAASETRTRPLAMSEVLPRLRTSTHYARPVNRTFRNERTRVASSLSARITRRGIPGGSRTTYRRGRPGRPGWCPAAGRTRSHCRRARVSLSASAFPRAGADLALAGGRARLCAERLAASESCVIGACDLLRLFLGHRPRLPMQVHRVNDPAVREPDPVAVEGYLVGGPDTLDVLCRRNSVDAACIGDPIHVEAADFRGTKLVSPSSPRHHRRFRLGPSRGRSKCVRVCGLQRAGPFPEFPPDMGRPPFPRTGRPVLCDRS